MNEAQPQTVELTPGDALAVLAERAQTLVIGNRRVAIGMTGGPGVGKSTLAVDLVDRLNSTTPGLAAYVPMDGFHMQHAKLKALGTVHEKGMPHTFEGTAFADFLKRLMTADGPVSGPGYSRKIEDVVDNAFTVGASVKLLVVEGNYLLLDPPPWDRIRPLLDLAVFIDVPRETVRARLLRRHAEEGLFTEERNREHIERVDLANYDLVRRSRPRADLAIDLLTES